MCDNKVALTVALYILRTLEPHSQKSAHSENVFVSFFKQMQQSHAEIRRAIQSITYKYACHL